MFENIPHEQIRNACRARLENLERWLRRLVDDRLSQYSPCYFEGVDQKDQRYVKSRIAKDAKCRIVEKGTGRYPRLIDAVLLEDLVQIICARWEDFDDALLSAFPQGREEARTFMGRLIAPRNKLSHANPISMREAEQVFCYSGDIISSLKEYYALASRGAEYNVPTIARFRDSLGNSLERSQLQNENNAPWGTFRCDPRLALYPGDLFGVEVEIDPTFDPKEYIVNWWGAGLVQLQTLRRTIVIKPQHVGQQWQIICDVISNKEWHRLNDRDDQLRASYKVLPPI